MKTIMNNRLMRMVLCSFMFASLLAGFQVANANFATQAQADDAVCGGVGACLGTVAVVVASGNAGDVFTPGGSEPVTVGDGGLVSAPTTPKQWDPTEEKLWDQFQTRVQWHGSAFAQMYGCNIKQVLGFDIKPQGVVIVEKKYIVDWTRTSQDGDWYPVYGDWQPDGHSCIYPPDPVITGTNMSCILSYNAHIDRMANSRLGSAPNVASNSGTLTDKATLEAQGISNCDTQKSVGLNYLPPNGQSGWGQYQAYSQITQINCNFATTTFDGVGTDVGKCGNPVTVDGSASKLTVWCDGYSAGWLNKSWTGTDCENTSQTKLQCVIPDAATYNGYANSVQALRDGNNGLVKWGNPVLIGGWGDSNWISSTFIKDGSSPRKSGVGDNDTNNQMFVSDVPFSANASGFITGKRLDQNLAFYTAGDAGAPFQMERNYKFSAWSNTLQVSITGIDLRSGVVSTNSYLVATHSDDNFCGPQLSPNISVIRAIGDKIG